MSRSIKGYSSKDLNEVVNFVGKFINDLPEGSNPHVVYLTAPIRVEQVCHTRWNFVNEWTAIISYDEKEIK